MLYVHVSHRVCRCAICVEFTREWATWNISRNYLVIAAWQSIHDLCYALGFLKSWRAHATVPDWTCVSNWIREVYCWYFGISPPYFVYFRWYSTDYGIKCLEDTSVFHLRINTNKWIFKHAGLQKFSFVIVPLVKLSISVKQESGTTQPTGSLSTWSQPSLLPLPKSTLLTSSVGSRVQIRFGEVLTRSHWRIVSKFEKQRTSPNREVHEGAVQLMIIRKSRNSAPWLYGGPPKSNDTTILERRE